MPLHNAMIGIVHCIALLLSKAVIGEAVATPARKAFETLEFLHYNAWRLNLRHYIVFLQALLWSFR